MDEPAITLLLDELERHPERFTLPTSNDVRRLLIAVRETMDIILQTNNFDDIGDAKETLEFLDRLNDDGLLAHVDVRDSC